MELINPAKLGLFQAVLLQWIFYWQRSIVFLTIESTPFLKSNPFLVQLEPSEVNTRDEIKHVHFVFFTNIYKQKIIEFSMQRELFNDED